MLIKEIKYNSLEYMTSLRLRSEILRAPLGKQLSSTDTSGEESQLHYGCFKGKQLTACVVAMPTENVTGVKLRQMAIAASFQGQGVGKNLLLEVELFLRKKGFNKIKLSARRTALFFYEKLGYEVVGEFYLEQGIEHIEMQKTI